MPERSFRETEALVRNAIKATYLTANPTKKYYYTYVRDIFPSTVVYTEESDDYESPVLSQRSYVIDINGTVTLGEATRVIEQKSYQPLVKMAAFSIEPKDAASGSTEVTDYIEKEGLLFKAGNYPDKQYSMTSEEVKDAIQKFEPVDLELEHFDSKGEASILSGKFGKVVALSTPDNGQTLYAKTRLSKWVKDAVGDVPIKTSAVWNPDTKTLARVGLVLTPRISDAVLMSAYATFAGKRHSAEDELSIQNAHDALVRAGAQCPKVAQFHKEITKMSLKDKFFAWLDGVEAEQATPNPPAPAVPNPAPAPAPAPSSSKPQPPDPEIERLRRENAQFREEKRKNEAAVFAASVITDRRALPAEKDALIAQFSQAAADDEAHPTQITFSEGGVSKQGSRVDALKAMIATRPQHALFSEQVGNPQIVTLSAGAHGGEDESVKQAREGAAAYAKSANGPARKE